MRYLIITALVMLGLAAPAWAVDIPAASCSATHVQAAVNAAVTGDRVLVPAGGRTWGTLGAPHPEGKTTHDPGRGPRGPHTPGRGHRGALPKRAREPDHGLHVQ